MIGRQCNDPYHWPRSLTPDLGVLHLSFPNEKWSHGYHHRYCFQSRNNHCRPRRCYFKSRNNYWIVVIDSCYKLSSYLVEKRFFDLVSVRVVIGLRQFLQQTHHPRRCPQTNQIIFFLLNLITLALISL